MCDQEVNQPLSPSRSPSNPPQFQLHPSTPEKFPNPNIQKRMQGDTCFKCHQQGHWSWFCPLNSPNKNPLSSSSSSHSPTLHSPQNIHCRCGYGLCIIKTSKSERNPGRKYYACPVKRGAQCNGYGFMKWCDEPVDQSDWQPPLFKYPECECGAGVCRRVKGTQESTSVVKYYFECPVKKDHGSCGYQVSEDEVLNNTSIAPIPQSMSEEEVLNNSSITPTRKSRQRCLDDFYQNDKSHKTENDLGDGLCEGEGEDAGAVAEVDQSKVAGFPEFEIADDDLEFADLAIQAEADLLPSLSTPSRISARQYVFVRDIVDASLDGFLMGWLGRLVFVHPTKGLKLPTPQPFFCCVFPSFNPILVPKQASIILNGPSAQHTQLSTTSLTEVSRDVVSPNSPPGSGNKPITMSKRQREVALFMQQQLLSDLENLDPREQDSMREAAETTFTLLNRLEVDCEQFSQHVWDFINLTSSIVEMDKSMENSLTLEEHQKLFEEEEIKLDCIKDDLAETEALLEVSNRHRKTLCEEISHLEAMLLKKKNQLESCEVETLQMETQLGDLKRSMLKADITLRDRAEQVEVARKQSEERKAKQVAAKTALENAKLELEN
ncbi:uncharacterized protein LOC130729804 isoform X2 [Lotus japonicus]|uniref:uncharacterized protein LOC130729804 isoform X2 n=1 Tax=Lotus japonicus TaxID=34305 RepID=UPI002588964D|nr:uncharacterized protein LOC130729804 isoform X2 [Lotus japonicus]